MPGFQCSSSLIQLNYTPLEIRELVIKATIETDSGKSAAPNAAPASGANSTDPQEMLINLCVEKVLEILKEKQER